MALLRRGNGGQDLIPPVLHNSLDLGGTQFRLMGRRFPVWRNVLKVQPFSSVYCWTAVSRLREQQRISVPASDIQSHAPPSFLFR